MSTHFGGGGGVTLQQGFSENNSLGGGFKYFLFSPLPGEMIHFD